MTHVYADLLHGRYRHRMEASRMSTRAFGRKAIPRNQAQEGLCHLASRRVVGADEQHPEGATGSRDHGFRARTKAPITRPLTSRASTSVSSPAPDRNAFASSNS